MKKIEEWDSLLRQRVSLCYNHLMSKYYKKDAYLYIPDSVSDTVAFDRVTHLAIGAHQDDLEIMASHGIIECYDSAKLWFGGVTCTDGRGSAREGRFKMLTDDEMRGVRRVEQVEASKIGKYSFVLQLDYQSSEAKSKENHLTEEIKEIVTKTRPKIIYTHNPADKHATHVAVAFRVIQALRELPKEYHPERFYGSEVWRDLDWMKNKIPLDITDSEDFVLKLLSVYESQIAGGKRYDLATIGRMRANATYFESHKADQLTHLWSAMDLLPLLKDKKMKVSSYVQSLLEQFSKEIMANIKSLEN